MLLGQILQPGRDAGQPVDSRRRGAGQPDRAEGRRRRAKTAAAEDGRSGERQRVTGADVATANRKSQIASSAGDCLRA